MEEDEDKAHAEQEVEEEVQDEPAQEGSGSADEVGSIFPLLLSYTILYYEAYDVHRDVLFCA